MRVMENDRGERAAPSPQPPPARGGRGLYWHSCDCLRPSRRHADAMDFPLQRDAGGRMHTATYFLAEPFKICRGCGARVDQEVAVLLRYLSAAAGQAPTTGTIDQLPRLHVGWVAEGGAAGPCTHRLRGFARAADFRHACCYCRGDSTSRAQPGAH